MQSPSRCKGSNWDSTGTLRHTVVKLLCDTPAKRQSVSSEAQEASARQTYSLRLRFTKNTSPRLLDVLVGHTGSQWQGPNNNIPTGGVGHELLVRERA
jgi:hypothetical protein